MTVGAIFITLFYDLKNVIHLSFFQLVWNKLECSALLRETAPLCVCVCLQTAISTVPKYVLEKMCGEVALGAYSSVFAPTMLIQAATVYIFTPFVGQFSKYYFYHEVDKFKRLFLQIGMCIISMGLITVLCARTIGWKLMDIIFGPVIAGYEYLLIPIIFCTFANAILGFCCMLSVVIRDFQGQMFSCLLGFIICVVCTIVCISNFGINGTSYGLLIGSIIANIILIIRIIFIISKLEQKTIA